MAAQVAGPSSEHAVLLRVGYSAASARRDLCRAVRLSPDGVPRRLAAGKCLLQK